MKLAKNRLPGYDVYYFASTGYSCLLNGTLNLRMKMILLIYKALTFVNTAFQGPKATIVF